MGVVWLGRDRITGTAVAIKVLRPELAADPGAVARFVRERNALLRFRHPNVVTLHDMIVEGDCLALVMDLIGGGDLGAYRRSRGGTLPPGEALGLTAQVCDALAAAHAAGIVHRDLKPANVLLDAGQVRLADFGIARIAGESPATTTGVVVGTIGFMAPEVIRGEEPTPACDVYAAGVTLYELLTGGPPFTGQAAAVIHDHLETMPSQPAGLPGRLWTLLSACLSKDPAARPPAAFLAGALLDPALLPEPAPPFEPAWAVDSPSLSTFVRRPAPATGPAALDATIPPAQALPVNSLRMGAGPGGAVSAQPAGSRRPRSIALLATTVAAAVAIGGGTAAYLVMSGPTGSKPAGGPSQPQLGAAAQSRIPALAGSASQAPGKHPSRSPATGTAGPSAGAGTPVATAQAGATPSSPGTSSSAPASSSSSSPAAPAGTPGPTGPELVADGDFTQPNLSAWNNQVLNTAVVSSGRDGGYAAQMTGQPTAGVSQIVTGLKPGTTYELTGWIYSGTGDYSTYVGVKKYDTSAGQSRALDPASTWSEVSMTFTPATGYTSAEVFCWQAVAGTGFCTDVSLHALS